MGRGYRGGQAGALCPGVRLGISNSTLDHLSAARKPRAGFIRGPGKPTLLRVQSGQLQTAGDGSPRRLLIVTGPVWQEPLA